MTKLKSRIINYVNVTINRGGNPVLTNVTFELLSGDLLYLTGRVGSGKSTLLKTIYAQLPITSGAATVMGYFLPELSRYETACMRREMGIVFQDFQLLMDRNVLDNLKFVLKATGWRGHAAIDQRIEQVLTQVNMTSKAYEMPHRLSGGEQQRIAIARALLNSPRLILADEPTGNLDHDTAREIMQMLQDIAHRDTAVLMATHNLSLIDQFPAPQLHCQDHHITLLPQHQ